MKPFRTVGVIGKRREPHRPTLDKLCSALESLGCEVLLAHNDELLDLPAGRRVDAEELASKAELAIVVGGDGTLLGAGRYLAPAGVPLLGVNQGRLGFLVDIAPDEMAESLAAVIGGRYELEERLILSARLTRNGKMEDTVYTAVNDVVLRNQASIRMIEFESWMGEQFISLHRADGMIVCSPTGSTAYALSGGGPLLHPSLQAMALVPICPHTLSDRPIVIGGDQRVTLVVRGEDTEATVTFDGQISEALEPGDSILIERSEKPLRLIHPTGSSYFAILRNKLRWGRGQESIAER